MFSYIFSPAAAILALTGLLLYSIRHFFGQLTRAQEAPGPPPEALKRISRERVITRVLFIFWSTATILHRAWIIYLLMSLGDSANSNDHASFGMALWFLDPWAALPIILGLAAINSRVMTGPPAAFYGQYIGFSLIIDAMLLYLLWLCSRQAFRAPVENKADTAPQAAQPPAGN
ncbi:MAG: hypothetical protein A2234_07525 [Elusimicrobia bacterium RIFOXYA2_FULL_58_8]|nr:MAG: hypothetical protein A2234_07525 [Elusimicrobia bacterium RIFOXYA2_FULL_58_8]OGS13719.1 MAG: hypothetical protein A2285_01290 [Elusimicrobia bacterium RIFOXYA12_FULL_57_11]